MAIQINLHQPPFSFLSEEQLAWLTKKLDLVFFPAGTVILNEGDQSPGLFVIYKGLVEETNQAGDQVFSQYGTEDMFDVRAVLESTCKHRYTAMEETLCYLLRSKDFAQLIDQSPKFSTYFYTDLGTQQTLVDQFDRGGLSEFIMARIDEECMRTPVYVPGQTSLARVVGVMHEQKCDAVLVRTAKEVGIVTGTDLLKATLLGDKTKQARVAEVAQFNLIDVEYGDFLFNALIKMTQHKIERVVVNRDGDIVGLLELKDLLSVFSTHSHVVAIRIEQANSINELGIAARRLETLVKSLSDQGVKVSGLMELVTTLNRRLIQRAFELIVPRGLQQSLCLLCLGSEGRGEQILKTDQDNAIVLRRESDRAALQPYLQPLHQALLSFGYPPCPGGVMFINEQWVHTAESWRARIQDWTSSAQPDAMMQLAIFMDAEPVCGDLSLFDDVRKALLSSDWRAGNMLSWFAKPAIQFETPLTFLGKIRENNGAIDIKKGGIFPIVHGVRALSLEYGIHETNSLQRIDELSARHIIDDDTAQGLKNALMFFIRIRLRQQLETFSENPGLSQDVVIKRLHSADRNMMRHALHRVKKFKQLLTSHYRLESF